MREITLQELAALAENAKGEIRRIYLRWTAGHYSNTCRRILLEYHR